MDFDWMYLLAAIGGGMFGAALGAVPAFVLAGFAAAGAFGYSVIAGTHPDLELASLSGLAPFGPWLSPNIAFAGGVAAAAYAARRKLHASGNDTVLPLTGLQRPDVLVVGGLFGAYGYVLQWLFTSYSPTYAGNIVITPIVTAIVLSNMTSRLVFGRSGLFGKPEPSRSRWAPTETHNWVPWQERPLQVLAIGFALGLPSAYLVSEVPSFGFDLGLAISATWLLFLCLGFKTPVAHHVTLGAAIGVLVLGNFWWGLALAVAGALIGEVLACIFQYHGDTAIDPPSVALLVLWLFAVFTAPVFKPLSEGAAASVGAVLVALLLGLLVMLKRGTDPLPAIDEPTDLRVPA
jgi:hypothetical protein